MRRPPADRRRTFVAWLLGLGATMLSPLGAQSAAPAAALCIAVAAAPQRSSLPALQWLCEVALPQQASWPRGLDAAGPFVLRLDAQGLTIARGEPLPRGVAIAGSCRLGEGPAALFECRDDGVEDWFVPADFVVPAPWWSLLQRLEADVLDLPRRLDAAVVLGHLAGAVAEGDERQELLQLAAAGCGTVTWTAWRGAATLRVRGRGDGGLVLPALLLVLADGDGASPELSLRAFAARDDDRAEAARQLGRRDDPQDLATLRALLFADDDTCLAAIGALVRRGAVTALPDIVAAATDERPFATRAAIDAVTAMWPAANPTTKQRVRAAIQRSSSLDMRALDVGADWRRLPDAARDRDDGSGRARLLVLLLLSAICLYGLWCRERARQRPAAALGTA